MILEHTQNGIDPVELTQQLLNIQSVNPPGDESECAKFLNDLLAGLGFSTVLHEFGKGRFNLVAEIEGKSSDLPLAFTGHMDTVPLGMQAWHFPEFKGHIENGKLYGRGSSDMKSGIASFISACVDLKEEITQGSGVILILTGGEETGCDGAKHMIQEMSHLLKEVSFLIVGEPTLNYPFIGHKGALWLKAESFGKTAHGAMPEQGSNAIYKATEAVNLLKNFDFNAEQHPIMGNPTFNVGTFKAGINVNSVPDYATFTIDIRSTPVVQHQCICSQLAEYLPQDLKLSSIVDVPSLCADSNSPEIQQAFALVQPYQTALIEPRAVPYFTDGSVLIDALGKPDVIILGPGDPKMAHQTDEYCGVDKIYEAKNIYTDLIRHFI